MFGFTWHLPPKCLKVYIFIWQRSHCENMLPAKILEYNGNVLICFVSSIQIRAEEISKLNDVFHMRWYARKLDNKVKKVCEKLLFWLS